MFAVSLLSFTSPKMLGTLERCACVRFVKEALPRAVSALSARFGAEALIANELYDIGFARIQACGNISRNLSLDVWIAFTDIHRVVVIRVVAAIFRDELE